MRFTELTDCPYYLFSRVSLQVAAALKKGFREAGVPKVRPAYLGVLMSLWQDDVLRMAALGRRAGLEPSTMTGLLDRMERDGLVTRNVDPHDRRAQQVRLTRRGRDVRTPVEAVVTAVMDRVFADIPGAELERTKRLLRRVLGNLGLQEVTGK